jgi:hypothetical protein
MKNLFLKISLVLFTACAANAQTTLFTYDFPGTPGSTLAANQTNNTQPANATFGNVTFSNANQTTGTDYLNTTGYSSGGYFSFSITANSGYQLDLTSLSYRRNRSSTGPDTLTVAAYVNGSQIGNAYSDPGPASSTTAPPPASSVTTWSFDPTTRAALLADSGAGNPIEFRFFASGGTGGNLRFDNIATVGSITPVPELSTIFGGALSLGIVGIAGYRRLRSPRTK